MNNSNNNSKNGFTPSGIEEIEKDTEKEIENIIENTINIDQKKLELNNKTINIISTEELKKEEIQNKLESSTEKLTNDLTIVKRLDALEINLIDKIYNKDINAILYDSSARNKLNVRIKQLLPYVNDSQLNTQWYKVKNAYFQSIKRIPAETLINKITLHMDSLVERIENESEEDITKQSESISKLYKLIADVNKISEVAPNIQINFVQELSKDDLLNPSKQIDIQIKPE